MLRGVFFLMMVLMLAPLAATAGPDVKGLTAGVPHEAAVHLMVSCTPHARIDQLEKCNAGQTCTICNLLCHACNQAAVAAQSALLEVVGPTNGRPTRLAGDYLSAEHLPNFKPPIL